MDAQQFVAALDHRLTEAAPRTIRVGRTFHGHAGTAARVPFIRLAGHWLSQAGFQQGDQVSVSVRPGEIRLTRNPAPSPQPPSEPELFA